MAAFFLAEKKRTTKNGGTILLGYHIESIIYKRKNSD